MSIANKSAHQSAFGCVADESAPPRAGALLQRQADLVRIMQRRREPVQLRIAKAVLFARTVKRMLRPGGRHMLELLRIAEHLGACDFSVPGLI